MKKINGLLIFCLLLAQLSMTVRSDSEVNYVHNDRVDARAEYKKRVLFLCAAMVGTIAAFTLVEVGLSKALNYRAIKKFQKKNKEEDDKLHEFLTKNGYTLRFNPETHVTEVFDAQGKVLPVKNSSLGKSWYGRAYLFEATSPLIKPTCLYNFVNEQGESVVLHGT